MKAFVQDNIRVLGGADIFAYSKPTLQSRQSSPISWIGSFAVVSGILVIVILSCAKFLKHPSEMSADVDRREQNVNIRANPVGMRLFRNGRAYANESHYRWRFRYRAYFYGHSRLSDPRYVPLNIDLPTYTCQVYYDLTDDTDPDRFETHPTGAAMGEAQGSCVDLGQAEALLRQQMFQGANIEEPKLLLQGTYADPAYRWLQADLNPCSAYGPAENITCATTAERNDHRYLSMDIVALDSIGPKKVKWSNLYLNFDWARWIGYEIYFRPSFFTDESKSLPFLYDPVVTEHLYWQSFAERSRPRLTNNTGLVSLYFRLDSLVAKVEKSYYNMSDAFESVGSLKECLWMGVGMTCLYINFVIHYWRTRSTRSTNARSGMIPPIHSHSDDQDAPLQPTIADPCVVQKCVRAEDDTIAKVAEHEVILESLQKKLAECTATMEKQNTVIEELHRRAAVLELGPSVERRASRGSVPISSVKVIWI